MEDRSGSFVAKGLPFFGSRPRCPRRSVVSVVAAPVSSSTVVVAVDAGRNSVAVSVTDAGRHRLLGPVEFA